MDPEQEKGLESILSDDKGRTMMNKTKRNEQKIIEQKRTERKEHALWAVLDENQTLTHFWDALLIHSIDKASGSADRLSRRVLWLNVILVLLGILSLLIVGYEVFCK